VGKAGVKSDDSESVGEESDKDDEDTLFISTVLSWSHICSDEHAIGLTHPLGL
jgi:hypothetical protein